MSDPIGNLNALKKANILFTDTEKEKIAQWQQSGQLAEAQKYILGKLEKTVGGTAKATRSMSDVMKVAIDNLNENLGKFLIPIFEKFAEVVVTKVIPVIQGFIDKQVPKMIAFFKEWANRIEPVVTMLANKLLPVLKRVGEWMADNTEVVAAFFVAIAGVAVIASLAWLATTIAALFTPINMIVVGIGLLAGAFTYAYQHFEVFRNSVDATARFIVNQLVPWLVSGFRWLSERIVEIFSGIVQYIRGIVEVIRGVIDIFLGALHGDWRRVWDGMKQIVHGVFEAIVGFGRAFLAPILNVFGIIWEGIRAGMLGVFDGLAAVFRLTINKALDIVEKGLNFAIGVLNKALHGIDIAAGPWINFGTIPKVSIPSLQQGGIVTMPTIALIAESSPEAVIPLNRYGAGATHYNTVEIAVNGGDPYAIVEALKKYYRTNGAIPIRTMSP